MIDPRGETLLWIEDAPPYLLHHYQDCPDTPATHVTIAVVRDSECSGPYAVQPHPPWPVLGDVCATCRRRYLYENREGAQA